MPLPCTAVSGDGARSGKPTSRRSQTSHGAAGEKSLPEFCVCATCPPAPNPLVASVDRRAPPPPPHDGVHVQGRAAPASRTSATTTRRWGRATTRSSATGSRRRAARHGGDGAVQAVGQPVGRPARAAEDVPPPRAAPRHARHLPADGGALGATAVRGLRDDERVRREGEVGVRLPAEGRARGAARGARARSSPRRRRRRPTSRPSSTRRRAGSTTRRRSCRSRPTSAAA